MSSLTDILTDPYASHFDLCSIVCYAEGDKRRWEAWEKLIEQPNIYPALHIIVLQGNRNLHTGVPFAILAERHIDELCSQAKI